MDSQWRPSGVSLDIRERNRNRFSVFGFSESEEKKKGGGLKGEGLSFLPCAFYWLLGSGGQIPSCVKIWVTCGGLIFANFEKSRIVKVAANWPFLLFLFVAAASTLQLEARSSLCDPRPRPSPRVAQCMSSQWPGVLPVTCRDRCGASGEGATPRVSTAGPLLVRPTRPRACSRRRRRLVELALLAFS